MKYQFHLEAPAFQIGSIDIQSVGRPKGYRHSFKNGRAEHGFIYVVSGRMCDTIYKEEEELLYADAGDLVFMPKGSIYTGTYALDGTEIKIVQFDLSDGSLPDYLSSPVKLSLPNAGELIGAFFEPIESHAAVSYASIGVSVPFLTLSTNARETSQSIPP